MAALIALAALCMFAVGVVAGITGVAVVAIHREERNLTMTRATPDNVTRAGRLLTGLYVRGLHVRAPAAP
jgi:hypothetical protein